MHLPLGTFNSASAKQRCTFAEMTSPGMHALKTKQKNISALHLESAAHEPLAVYCICRAVAWSPLWTDCIRVYSGEFI